MGDLFGFVHTKVLLIYQLVVIDVISYIQVILWYISCRFMTDSTTSICASARDVQ